MGYAISASRDYETTPEGWRVHCSYQASYTGPKAPYEIKMTLVLVDGRYEVGSFTAQQKPGGPGVNADGLRAIPVARWAEEFIRRAQVIGPLGIKKRKFPGPTEDALKTVARVYRAAYLRRANPTVEVMRTLGLPRATASVWIDKARAEGFLGEAEQGKAGI